jgi:hypothetical protein
MLLGFFAGGILELSKLNFFINSKACSNNTTCRYNTTRPTKPLNTSKTKVDLVDRKKNVSNSFDHHLSAILDSPVIETSLKSFKLKPLSSSRSLYLKTPMSIEKTLLSEENQFPLLSKHNRSYKSYHDLIVESKSKQHPSPPTLPPSSSLKSQSALNYYIPAKSNLYNLDKINESIVFKNKKIKKKKTTCIESEIFNQRNKSSLRAEKSQKRNFEKSSFQQFQQAQKLNSNKHVVTLESIKPTVNILNTCKSIDYIASIMKTKSDLDRVMKRK